MGATKKAKEYALALAAVRELLTEGELDRIGAMASVAAILHETMSHFDWTGFYRVTAPRLLTIGPYQGHLACLKIPFERGVCGLSAREKQTIVVPDVRNFPGYIA